MPGEHEFEPGPTVSLKNLVDLLLKKLNQKRNQIKRSYGKGADIKSRNPDARQSLILGNINLLATDLGLARTRVAQNPELRNWRGNHLEVLVRLTDLLNLRPDETHAGYRYAEYQKIFPWQVYADGRRLPEAHFRVQSIWISGQPLPDETCDLFHGSSLLERVDFNRQKVRFLPVTYLCEQVK